MLRKSWLVGLAALALFLVPSAAQAQFQQGDWELTLAGTGASDNEFVTNNFSVNGSLGYFFSDQIEVGLRQGITAIDVPGSSDDYAGSTRVFADFHIDLDRWQPFIGAQLGYIYGDNTSDTWVAGPEAGVKYFINSTTFVVGAVEYQFFFDDSDAASDNFDDGQFIYSLGLGVVLGRD